MNIRKFFRQKSGARIEPRTLNQPIAEIERLARLNVAAPLVAQDTTGGVAIRREERPWIWAKLTSVSSGAYAWTEQLEQPGGTWIDGFKSGTTSADSAYNTVSSATLTLPLIVPMRRNAAGEWTFTAGACPP